MNMQQLWPHARIVVVCPVCKPDLHLALKWIAWSRWLATKTESTYDLVVFGAKSLDAEHIVQLKQAISGWDKARFELNPTYYERPELGYGAMANSEFRNALEMTERLFPGRATLWAEPDAIPTRPSWVQEIDKEYAECDAEFLGDFHALGAIPHMTGNAVYSANWRKVAPSIAKLPMPNPAQGWDTQNSHETLPQSARSRLIQQAWIVPPPRFNEVEIKRVHPSTALFHRCKDGSLIDILSKRQGGPEIPLTPAIARPTGTKLHKLIVQQPVKAITAPEQFAPRKPKGPYPQMEILIVSHKKDAEFLQFCLRSIDQYARGFASVKVVAPDTDIPYFIGVPEKTTFIPYRETPGKGMLQHMIQKCRADEHCPEADFILHMDSDCMMWQPTTPNDFLPNGKCLMVRQHYDIVQKLNRARMKWRENVKAATGYVPEYDTMVRHPNVFPRDLYAHVRNTVESHTGRQFDQYVFDGQDKFPQSFCEFVTLGNIGLRDFGPHFVPIDYDHEADSRECGINDRRHQYIYRPGRDKIVEFWSHGGFSKYRMDANRFLRGSLPKFYLK